MFKVIVAGGRDFSDYDKLHDTLLILFQSKNYEDIQIVSGGAKGADRMGEDFAEQYSLPKPALFPADWDTYSRSAGHIRNAEMADYADALVAFWDGKSKGTEGMIKVATKKGLAVRVIMYE